MAPRARLGKQSDGTFGLRCSLPGNNVSSADPNGPGFSFDSDWANIVKIALTGTANIAGGTLPVAGTPTVVSHGVGFAPFFEARLLSGSVINDDTVNLSNVFTSNRFSGVPAVVDTSNITFNQQASGFASGGFQPFIGYSVIYVVYLIPIGNLG